MTKTSVADLKAQQLAKQQIKQSGPPAQSIPALIERLELMEKAMGLK